MVENLGLSLYRQSQDSSKTNTFGSRLIELCKNNNLVKLNGLAGEDKGTYRKVHHNPTLCS